MFYEIGYVLFFYPQKDTVYFYMALVGSYVKSELHGFMRSFPEGSQVMDSINFEARFWFNFVCLFHLPVDLIWMSLILSSYWRLLGNLFLRN